MKIQPVRALCPPPVNRLKEHDLYLSLSLVAQQLSFEKQPFPHCQQQDPRAQQGTTAAVTP